MKLARARRTQVDVEVTVAWSSGCAVAVKVDLVVEDSEVED